MIVSDSDLKTLALQGLAIRADGEPLTVDLVSIGLHLGTEFLQYTTVIEPNYLPFAAPTEVVYPDQNGNVKFPPGARLLASTSECVAMPLNCMGFIQTKGTIARGFVTVHLCDGQIDPGFRGSITLELVNFSNFDYILRPGMPIAQLFIHRLSMPVTNGYQGRYQGASGPTSMRT